MRATRSDKSTTKIIQDAIATPDVYAFAAERKASEQSADTLFKDIIRQIEEEDDEFQQRRYENLIRATRIEVKKILIKFNSFRFAERIYDFLAQQGTGEEMEESVLYSTKYEESVLFQDALKRLPLFSRELNKISELFHEHNLYIDILAKIMARLTQPHVVKCHSHPLFHPTEIADEPESKHVSEVDHLFHCHPRISLMRQGF